MGCTYNACMHVHGVCDVNLLIIMMNLHALCA